MEIKKINNTQVELPIEGDMKVPGIVFASQKLLDKILDDKSLEQVKNVAKLPGIIKASIVMPDVHQGYGFAIGGVAAFDKETGVISPGGVGYDINCGVRLLRTNLAIKDLKGKEEVLLNELFKVVPTGVGCKGELKINLKELDEILKEGAQWMVKKGYGNSEDTLFLEEEGKMSGANPRNVSQRAKARGLPQIGTLGAGNHFLDVLVVEEVFDEKVSKVFGLKKDQIVMLIHCGSRGLGHQVASDYIKLMDKEYGHPEFDRELVNAPINSYMGQNYLAAMAAAANFSFANKQLITHNIREAFKKYFPKAEISVVYEICHNIAKFEKYEIDGKEKELLVMRKGATRSFGPGRIEIPEKYRKVGQPIIIPGSMGTPSYVLCGTNESKNLSFSSTAHGAGRAKSRTSAKKERNYEEAKKEMEKRGVLVKSGSLKGLVEEFPESYKDVNEVVDVSHNAGIGKKVAKLRPLMVVIG